MISLNIFKKTPAEQAEDTFAGARLLQGRTSKHLERLMAELEAERSTLAELEFELGDCELIGQDSSAVEEKARKQTERVKRKEVAVAVALAKDEQARIDKAQAELTATIAKRYETRMHFKTVVGAKVENYIAEGKRLIEEDIIPASAAAEAATADGHERYFINEARMEFKRMLMHALSSYLREGAAPTMKYEKWSDCIPTVDRTIPSKREG